VRDVGLGYLPVALYVMTTKLDQLLVQEERNDARLCNNDNSVAVVSLDCKYDVA